MAPTPEPDELHKMRHSLAHILTQAMFKIRPNLKYSIGPPIENGFYFDYLFDEPLTPELFPKLEKEMKRIIQQSQSFKRIELSTKEAKEFWKKKGQPFKVEMIEDLEKEGAKTVTHYANLTPDGKEVYVDLCRGGHVDNTKELPIDGFKITHLAGAYWRGDEKREQLTRVYVAAFPTKAELDTYLTMLEEAKKRDHRKLGRELDLFVFSDMVGPGLPLWTPKGTIIADEVERLARETENSAGYLRVRTPHIAKGKLYEQTGHLAHYRETMFPPMILEEKPHSAPQGASRGGEEYYLKPMNCPHHHQIYASQPRSYRDLPLRLAEYGHCYRFEGSGALFGLMRVRSLSMNDAHIYLTEEQFEQEFLAVVQMYLKYFAIFDIKKYVMRLSLHDPKELGKKYVNEPKLWKKTEAMLRDVMRKSGCDVVEAPNEAAFYGPKIDVEVFSAIGREFSLATNQIDFDVPRKVGLTYRDSDGKEKIPLCIHRAPLGTHERFIGFLIEHFAGLFPLWLAPVQVAILPVAGTHEAYAAECIKKMQEAGLRPTLYDSTESLGKRIRAGEQQRIPYLLVLGDKEVADKSVAVRNIQTKEQVTISFAEFLEKTKADVVTRALHPSIG